MKHLTDHELNVIITDHWPLTKPTVALRKMIRYAIDVSIKRLLAEEEKQSPVKDYQMSKPVEQHCGPVIADQQAAGSVEALKKLCDQLDAMRRTMFLRPGTGQNYSYLVHEDVAAYVEEARAALDSRAQPVEDKDARLGRYLKEWARKAGWKDSDDEGAFEYVQRISYSLGKEDAQPVAAGELPPLPKAEHSYQASSDSEFASNWKSAYTADQMRAYGQQCADSRPAGGATIETRNILQQAANLACEHGDDLLFSKLKKLIEPAATIAASVASDDGGYIPVDMTEAKRMIVQLRGRLADLRAASVAQPGVAAALRFAANVLELYDDATMRADHMLDSGECADILRALATYPPLASPVAAAVPDGWYVMCGDWKEDRVALHNHKGHIVSGLTVEQARALIDAHGGAPTTEGVEHGN